MSRVWGRRAAVLRLPLFQQLGPGRCPMRPGQAEGQVVIDLGADVLDDQCVHKSGQPCRKLVGVDAAQGVAEYDRAVDPQMFQYCRCVLDVAVAGEIGRNCRRGRVHAGRAR